MRPNLSLVAQAALKPSLRPDRRALTEVEPDFKKEPLVWAAWQSCRTHLGIHDEQTTARLMGAPEKVKQIWEEVTAWCGACQKHQAALLA